MILFIRGIDEEQWKGAVSIHKVPQTMRTDLKMAFGRSSMDGRVPMNEVFAIQKTFTLIPLNNNTFLMLFCN